MKKYLLLFALISFNASAQEPIFIEKYGDWSAYYYNDGAKDACFITSNPMFESGKYTSRQNVSLTITHRPSEDFFDLVTIKGGYLYKRGAPVSIKVGSRTINKFFTTKDEAWPINSKIDKEVLALLRRGIKVIVTATNSNNIETKDTYSLKGFNQAYKTISQKCKNN